MKLSDQRNKLASLELAIELGSIVEEAVFLVRLARSPWVESTGVVSRDDRSDWFCRLPASPSPSHFAAYARLIPSSWLRLSRFFTLSPSISPLYSP